VGKKGLLSKV